MPHKSWEGVKWARRRDGKCTVHGIRVGEFTECCYGCHREQLNAAGVALPAVAPGLLTAIGVPLTPPLGSVT